MLHGEAGGIEPVDEIGLFRAFLFALRVFFLGDVLREDRLIQPRLDGPGLAGGHPVQRGLHLAHAALAAGAAFAVHRADQLDHFAVFILHHFVATDDVRAFETRLAARSQAEELLGRILHEILALDVEHLAELYSALAHFRVIRVVFHGELVDFVLAPVAQRHLEGPEHGHSARRALAQRLAHTVLEQGAVHLAVGLGHAHALDEIADGLRRIAPAAHGDERGHARIVPAGNVAFFHQAAQVALAHHRAGDVQPGEFNLPRRMFKPGLLHHPVVQRAVDFVFQRAQRVRDALDRVLNGMLEIVHRVDAPLIARAVVVVAQDAVHGGVAHEHVGRSHINLRAQHARSIGEFARLHALE